jgi:hypothetical protein
MKTTKAADDKQFKLIQRYPASDSALSASDFDDAISD